MHKCQNSLFTKHFSRATINIKRYRKENSMDDKPEMQATCLKMPRDIHTKLKILSIRKHVSMQKLMADIIEKAVNDEKEQ
jgi:hypothetical protein